MKISIIANLLFLLIHPSYSSQNNIILFMLWLNINKFMIGNISAFNVENVTPSDIDLLLTFVKIQILIQLLVE